MNQELFNWPARAVLLLLVAGVLASGGTTLLLLIVFATRRNNPRKRYTHKIKLYPCVCVLTSNGHGGFGCLLKVVGVCKQGVATASYYYDYKI
jgi:hypothetical protein